MEWIFPDLLRPESPTYSDSAYRQLKKLLAEAELLVIRSHDLRHSYTAAAIKSGDDIKTVQEGLGHATTAFTLNAYGHVTAQMRQSAAAKIDQAIR